MQLYQKCHISCNHIKCNINTKIYYVHFYHGYDNNNIPRETKCLIFNMLNLIDNVKKV